MNLPVGEKNGEDAEGRERRGGGCRKQRSRHGSQFLPEGRFMMSIPVPTLCASV